MQYNTYEAKARFSELIAAAAAGEEIVIARNGEPMVKLVAVVTPADTPAWSGRGFGLAEGLLEIPDGFDEPLPDDILRTFYS